MNYIEFINEILQWLFIYLMLGKIKRNYEQGWLKDRWTRKS